MNVNNEMSKDAAITLNKGVINTAKFQLEKVALAKSEFLELVKHDVETKYQEEVECEVNDLEDVLGEYARSNGFEYDTMYYEVIKGLGMLEHEWNVAIEECTANLKKLGVE